MVAEVRERLAVSKQAMRRVHMERFNLKTLNAVEGKHCYRVAIPNRLTALESSNVEVDICNKAWETY
jgi:ribosomal protein L32